MIWFLVSCVLFAFSLLNVREAYLDMRTADGAQPAVSVVARARMLTEGLRSAMLGISVLAAAFVYLSPNPSSYHTPAAFEVAVLISLFAYTFGTGAATLVSRRQRDILSHHLDSEE